MGLPYLMHRTVANEIRLSHTIGRGKFGEVWKGSLHGDDVAIKIFYSLNEKSWNRECQIYNTVLPRHETILAYLASDITSRHSLTQFWLITQYHSNGSVFDYLQERKISTTDLLRIIQSAAAGLAYLHTEIFGKERKPALAHRDFKSNNVLIKDDLRCCIADFGVSVLYYSDTKMINLGNLPKLIAGTKRYLSPEILDGTLESSNFDCYKKSDVYAFGLFLWEIYHRWELVKNSSKTYNLAYYENISHDTSIGKIRQIVCQNRCRPVFSDCEETEMLLGKKLQKISIECWAHEYDARLSSLRIKKTLNKLMH
ncbi:DgyrCDS8631 [Dimorphilus gyrociliatus]|uniref:receptor protein serine/threonine kinase n=1 Tax=Dimorphilus gyrociliatus TaxID=2664684 RepID=A0A7I8VVR7_9ANNE|nr:DgyrCDS8631 [Dimorphilus gyrociliatus]